MTAPSADAHVERLIAAVRDDARVLGVALIENTAGLPACAHMLVVTTWDGLVSLPAELARTAASAFGETPTRTWSRKSAWLSALGADDVRLDIELRRVGDLKPSRDGSAAKSLLDPRGLVAQWIRYSEAEHPPGASACGVAPHDWQVLESDLHLRLYEGDRVLLLPEDGGRLRHARESFSATDPVESALAARIDAVLNGLPRPGAGDRVIGGEGRASFLETFLKIADDEGFKGDRMLFGEAMKRLRDLAKREPVFDEGFVLPTFDAVEAAFSVGDAIGGCKPPLAPGVYVGVGVTPRDALEFWAAPCVRVAGAHVACVDDDGVRDVVLRTAGREPMISSLTSAIDAAWDRLPALIEKARAATTDSVDPTALLKSLHLPRTFVERAQRRVPLGLMCSRLRVALSLCAAGDDASPLVARKLALAAGRVLAGA